MKIEFKDDELAALFEGKKVKNKRYKSNPALVKQYVKTVKHLVNANQIEDLLQSSSLNYEKLVGDRVGNSSVKINKQFRLIFKEVEDDSDPPQVVLLTIEEISNHYQ